MSNQTRLVLISQVPDPQRLCTAAARLSSLPGVPTKILDETPEGGYPDYLRRIMGMGHHSVLEHAVFTVAFENVSAFVEQFVITFRLFSFTVKSRRYVPHGEAGYVVPHMAQEGPSDLFSSEDKPYIGPEFYGPLSQRYLHFCEGLFMAYKRLLDLGVPAEDARFVLPYSFKSNFIVTGNARSFIHLISEATNGRGKQYPEVHWIGEKLKEMLSGVAPAIFSRIDEIDPAKNEKEQALSQIVTRLGLSRSFDCPRVELLSHTPNADRLVALTALTGASRAPASDVSERINEQAIRDAVKAVCSSSHARELEQVTFTFRLSGMSLPMLTHLTRHRMQSVIVPSFMQAGRSEVVCPPTIEANPEAKSAFLAAIQTQKSFWEAMDRFGVPPENRIYAYLAGQTIDCITTMNARELHHFLTLRTCNRAQWEIRDYAALMLKEVKRVAPMVFEAAGPNCYRFGECKEGRMSCGKVQEVREHFRSLT